MYLHCAFMWNFRKGKLLLPPPRSNVGACRDRHLYYIITTSSKLRRCARLLALPRMGGTPKPPEFASFRCCPTLTMWRSLVGT